MSKKPTPLEAFCELKKIILDLFVDIGDCHNNLKIIENALKRLEEIDNRPFINGIREEIPADAICKKLKALEIIKEKVDSIEYLQSCAAINETLEHYNEIISCTHGTQLTQEEFDLLKEVFNSYGINH